MNLKILPLLAILAVLLISGCTTDKGTTGRIIQQEPAIGGVIQQEPECIPEWQCSEWSKCSPQGTQTRACTDTNNCGTNLGKPVESQSCTYIASIGDPVIVGNLKYIVTDAFATPVVGGGFITKEADGIFLILTISIENIGKDSEYISSGNFKLTDYKDRNYKVDSAMFYLSTMGYEALIFDDLGPGLTPEGSIIFDVPEDDKGLELIISGGFLSGIKRSVKIGDVSDLG